MITFEEILAARQKLVEARLACRELALRCETRTEWELLAGAFYGHHKRSTISNGHVWLLLGVTEAEARAILQRTDSGGLRGEWPGATPEWEQLATLEDRLPTLTERPENELDMLMAE